MTSSPVIYLSAPTRDLDSARRQVAELLAKRGCRVLLPVISPNGAGAEEVQQQIQAADMVIQIIGYQTTPFLQGLPLHGSRSTSTPWRETSPPGSTSPSIPSSLQRSTPPMRQRTRMTPSSVSAIDTGASSCDLTISSTSPPTNRN
ncbi:hypothetical protein [Verrucomicrobium spinosum]|uniref:hypothetical protein n=1 Tax=Verrucomicrobium spinosum TaxID=2736 RepID=UPI000B0216E9|nr:hypothetical protein [Verrucomicrobium spinosum]